MISVLDENDNPPRFLKGSYEAEVAENSPADTFLVPVSYRFNLCAIKMSLLLPCSPGKQFSTTFSFSACFLRKTIAYKTVYSGRKGKQQRFRLLVSNIKEVVFVVLFHICVRLNCSQLTIHFLYISQCS